MEISPVLDVLLYGLNTIHQLFFFHPSGWLNHPTWCGWSMEERWHLTEASKIVGFTIDKYAFSPFPDGFFNKGRISKGILPLDGLVSAHTWSGTLKDHAIGFVSLAWEDKLVKVLQGPFLASWNAALDTASCCTAWFFQRNNQKRKQRCAYICSDWRSSRENWSPRQKLGSKDSWLWGQIETCVRFFSFLVKAQKHLRCWWHLGMMYVTSKKSMESSGSPLGGH